MRILDSVEFAHRVLLPHLTWSAACRSVAVHPTCSLAQMGSADELVAVAAACAEQVVHPVVRRRVVALPAIAASCSRS